MGQASAPGAARTLRKGTLAAFAAYGMWGGFPIYWKLLGGVGAVQVLCHRVLWSGLFLVLVLIYKGRLAEVLGIWRHRASALAVAGCAALITLNWGVYIWAVQAGRVTESSLGYYITPLLSVAIGALFFHERADRWTKAAVLIAVVGIAVAAWWLGNLPWVSVALAMSFALYGALKKRAGLDALSGLAAETLMAMPFALVYLAWQHGGALLTAAPKVTILLVLAGPVTALPLLTFSYAALRIPLQRLGFIQYLSPTIQLALGVLLFGEHLGGPMLLAFGSVVVAVAMYAFTRPAQVGSRVGEPEP